jgi:23S rRNA (guanosine2251-2'-O)-methyltransferase
MTEFRKGKPPSKRGFAAKAPPRGGKKEFSREAKVGSDKPRRSFNTSGATRGEKKFDRDDSAPRSPRPPRREGDSFKPRSRDGEGFKPRSRDGEFKPRSRDGDGERRAAPRRDSDRGGFGDRRSAPRRDDDRKSFGDRKPRFDRAEGGERRPAPRRDGEGFKPRSRDGDFKPRSRDGESSFGERRSAPRRDSDRGGFGDRRSAPRREDDRGSFSDRRSSPRRDDDRGSFGDRKPFKKDFGDKPFKKDFGAKKEYAKKEYSGGSGADKRADARKGHEHVIYGIHAVVAALQNTAREVKTLWVTETTQKKLEGIYDAKRHPAMTIVEKSDIDKFVPEDAVHQGLAVAVEPLQETFLSDLLSASRALNAKPQLVVVLDEVTDPHNVGAVMRSMAAFGAKALVVHKYNAPTVTGVMAKIATGAVEHIPMVVVTNLASAIEELQIAGYYILGLDEKATIKLTDIPRQRHLALVMGAEGEGLRGKTRNNCDAIASIPSYGPIASLNVSNAAAIALYEVTREA